MAAPKGNQFAKGIKNPNAGRPTLRNELERQQELQELWNEFKPRFRKLGIRGNVSLLNAVFGKYIPDKLDIDSPQLSNRLKELTTTLERLANIDRQSNQGNRAIIDAFPSEQPPSERSLNAG